MLKTITLLRKYTIKPDSWNEFLAIWQTIAEVRKRYGFKILFALEGRHQNIFTWAFSFEGDIDKATEAYYADPERVDPEITKKYVTDWVISEVNPVEIP